MSRRRRTGSRENWPPVSEGAAWKRGQVFHRRAGAQQCAEEQKVSPRPFHSAHSSQARDTATGTLAGCVTTSWVPASQDMQVDHLYQSGFPRETEPRADRQMIGGYKVCYRNWLTGLRRRRSPTECHPGAGPPGRTAGIQRPGNRWRGAGSMAVLAHVRRRRASDVRGQEKMDVAAERAIHPPCTFLLCLGPRGIGWCPPALRAGIPQSVVHRDPFLRPPRRFTGSYCLLATWA